MTSCMSIHQYRRILREERIAPDDRRQDTDANAVVRVPVQGDVRGNNFRARLHVVVEEQQNLPRRAPGTLVPRRRRSEGGLFHHFQPVRERPRAERLSGTVARAIHHDDGVERRRRCRLTRQRVEQPQHRGATIVRGHDDGEPRRLSHALDR